MIDNIGQLDCVWNQLKPKLLGSVDLDQVIQSRKTHPKSGPHLLMAANIKRHGRRKFYSLPVCPHSYWKVNLSWC